MKRFIAIFMMICLMLGISSISVFAATVGQQLDKPENGWQRIDGGYSKIAYSGTWSTGTSSRWYANTYSQTTGTTQNVNFKFYGTKLRIICGAYIDRSSDISITIDGTTYKYSENINTIDTPMSLVFEKLELYNGIHTVSIQNNKSGYYFGIDAIDIDETGYLLDLSISTNLHAVADKAKVNLNWDTVKDATSYNVKRATSPGGIYTTIATSSAIKYVDSSVAIGTTYYYVVSAVTANGEGANSNEVAATVKSDDSIAKLSVLLNEGEQVQLSTSYNLDNNKNYTWSSTNEAVATVDVNGKVTAIAEGTADIYAQNADGTFKEYIPVKVVKGIADELRLAVHLKTGEKANLYLTDDASKVTWTSMDESIATVSTDGQVTGVKKGLAIVKAELDGQPYQIYVRVNG